MLKVLSLIKLLINMEKSRYDIITFMNIDTEPFEIQYDMSSPTNRYYDVLQPQEVRRLPNFIAAHALRHLIDQILNRRDVRTSNITERERLASQIIIGQEKRALTPMKSPDQIAIEEIDAYNKPSDLEMILKRKEEEVVDAPLGEDETPPPEAGEVEEFAGLKEEKAKPTRDELYAHARTKLGMILDKKTLKKFDDMSISELIKELSYYDE